MVMFSNDSADLALEKVLFVCVFVLWLLFVVCCADLCLLVGDCVLFVV